MYPGGVEPRDGDWFGRGWRSHHICAGALAAAREQRSTVTTGNTANCPIGRRQTTNGCVTLRDPRPRGSASLPDVIGAPSDDLYAGS